MSLFFKAQHFNYDQTYYLNYSTNYLIDFYVNLNK